MHPHFLRLGPFPAVIFEPFFSRAIEGSFHENCGGERRTPLFLSRCLARKRLVHAASSHSVDRRTVTHNIGLTIAVFGRDQQPAKLPPFRSGSRPSHRSAAEAADSS